MNKKNQYFLLFISFIFFFIFHISAVKAAHLINISDKVSDHAVSAGSDHLIKFTSPTGIDNASDQIEIHFPTAFDLSAITVADIDLSHGAVSGYETEETLASSPGISVWGVQISSNNIIFTAPTNAVVGEINANDIIVIEIGLNANLASSQIINPNTSGSYPVYIDGSFADYGAYALWVGNTSVGVSASESTADTTDPSVQVLSPNGGESYYLGDVINIKWSATDDTALASNPISLYYSINNGSSWVLIANDIANSSSYLWTANIISDYIKIRVSAKDSSGNIGEDDSDDFFSIKRKATGPVYTTDDDNVASYTEEQERIPTIDGSWAYPGDLIKCPEYTTVYFYGFDSYRHYFPNEAIFKTWYYDFSEVKIVRLEDLVKLRLGKNIKVRPGNTLVKVPTYPAVYVVGENSNLYHIPNEEFAEKLYGKNWKDLIIDIPVVFWGDYKIIGELNDSYYPNGTLIKYPNEAKVYLLENQKKRWFASEEAFYANHYYWQNIIDLDNNQYYQDAEDILYRENKLIDLVYESY